MTVHDDLNLAAELARRAGDLLLEHVRRGFEVEHKTPEDPVTAADREASELIVAGLRAARPHDGILSEEMEDDAARLQAKRVWIIDPIDGTKEFVNGTGDYAVSIGLAVDGLPVVGAVCAPARGDLYTGAVGLGVWKNGEAAGFSARPAGEALIAVSDTEHERELSAYDLGGMTPSGSIAYKLARIAVGEADATFTINPRSEWDIAAGHALVRAAGGDLYTRDLMPIPYNRPTPKLRRGLIGGRRDVVSRLAAELARLHVPEQQLYLTEQDREIWALLEGDEAARLVGNEHLHIRHAGGKVEALVTLEPAGNGWRVVRAEGSDLGRRTLLKDLQREYGALE